MRHWGVAMQIEKILLSFGAVFAYALGVSWCRRHMPKTIWIFLIFAIAIVVNPLIGFAQMIFIFCYFLFFLGWCLYEKNVEGYGLVFVGLCCWLFLESAGVYVNSYLHWILLLGVFLYSACAGFVFRGMASSSKKWYKILRHFDGHVVRDINFYLIVFALLMMIRAKSGLP
jgi:hypothetical protein